MRRLRNVGHLIVLCLVRCVVLGGPAWAQEVGTVAELKGTADIQRGGATMAATVGMKIQLHDEIRTGKPGYLLLVFQDQSVTAIADGSHLRIDEQVFNPEQGSARSVLKLLKGKIRALVSDYYHQAASEYRIETPTAVSGVRGTDFIMVYDPDGDYSEVVGVGGRVEVHNLLETSRNGVFVTTQELTRVERGRPPTATRLLDQATFLQYLEGLKFIGGDRADSLVRESPVGSGSEVPAPMQASVVIQLSEGAAAAAQAVQQAASASAAGGGSGAASAGAGPAHIGPPNAIADLSIPPNGSRPGFNDLGVITQPPAILDTFQGGPGDIGVRF